MASFTGIPFGDGEPFFGPGESEYGLAPGSGLRVATGTYELINDPTWWVSDQADGNGASIADTATYADILFPSFLPGAAYDVTPQKGGRALPYGVTPCLRYTHTGVNTVQLQVRIEGFDIFGNYITEESPNLEMTDVTGGATDTFYWWMSKCFHKVLRIQYKLENKNASDTLAVGMVHPLNVEAASWGLAGTNPRIPGIPDPLPGPIEIGINGNNANWGVSAPIRMGRRWMPEDGTTLLTIATGASASGIGGGQGEIVGGSLRTIHAAGAPDLTSPYASSVRATYLHDAGGGTYASVTPPGWFLDAFDALPQFQSAALEPPIGHGGLTIGAQEPASNGRDWEGDPNKIGILSNGFAMPLRQWDLYGGETGTSVYRAPSAANNHILRVTVNTNANTASDPLDGNDYPTTGFP